MKILLIEKKNPLKQGLKPICIKSIFFAVKLKRRIH